MIARWCIWIGLLGVLGGPSLVSGQFEPGRQAIGSFLDEVLDFSQPTAIRGRLRYIDVASQDVWVDWDQRSDDRPLFREGWHRVPGRPMLAVHPKDTFQLEQLRGVEQGVHLEMIIQSDDEGRRVILSFRDLSQPEKIPL